MSEPKIDFAREVTSASVKMAVGPGTVAVGAMTLNDWVLILGGISSVVIIVTTLWRFLWELRDRKRRAAP